MNKYQGSCFCGHITFEALGEPTFQFVCYCTDCQRLNAGGRLCGVMFERESICVNGQTAKYKYPGGSGDNIESHFCPNCGTRLYHFPKKYSNRVVVQVNTLNNFNYQPQRLIYPTSAPSWDLLLKITKHHDK